MVESGRRGVKNVKTVVKVFAAIVIVTVCLCLPTSAHSGRTDGKGGHYDRSTGEYHYHHGYPAHQHKNGVCPYDFDDQTDYNSNYAGGDSYSSTNNHNEHKKDGWIYKPDKSILDYAKMIFALPLMCAAAFFLGCLFMSLVVETVPFKIPDIVYSSVAFISGTLSAFSTFLYFFIGSFYGALVAIAEFSLFAIIISITIVSKIVISIQKKHSPPPPPPKKK